MDVILSQIHFNILFYMINLAINILVWTAFIILAYKLITIVKYQVLIAKRNIENAVLKFI